MVRRDRHDIVVDILRKASPGRRKTELMSDVGLSYLQTRQYLDTLCQKGLLEMSDNHQLRTTKRGLDYLEKCSQCLLYPWERQHKKS